MANLCDCSLFIDADDDLLDRIFEFIQGDEAQLDFSKIVPVPDDIYTEPMNSEEVDICREINLHDWAAENWGTPCNADVYGEGDQTIFFTTAWAPCLPVIKKLAELFPEAYIRYEYSEMSEAICGVEEYKNGQNVHHLSGEFREIWFGENENASAYEPLFDESVLPCAAGDISQRFIPTKTEGNKTMGQFFYKESYSHSNGMSYVCVVRADVDFVDKWPDYVD